MRVAVISDYVRVISRSFRKVSVAHLCAYAGAAAQLMRRYIPNIMFSTPLKHPSSTIGLFFKIHSFITHFPIQKSRCSTLFSTLLGKSSGICNLDKDTATDLARCEHCRHETWNVQPWKPWKCSRAVGCYMSERVRCLFGHFRESEGQ